MTFLDSPLTYFLHTQKRGGKADLLPRLTQYIQELKFSAVPEKVKLFGLLNF